MDGGVQPLLAHNIWIALPVEMRATMARLFNIPRSGESVIRVGTMINGNIAGEAQQDGYTARDLYAISIEKMQHLTGKDTTDFYQLFDDVCGIVKNYTLQEILDGKHRITTTPGLEVAPNSEESREKKDDEQAPKKMNWPQFMSQKRGEGKDMYDIQQAWKEYKKL